jgi:hypothetical protein
LNDQNMTALGLKSFASGWLSVALFMLFAAALMLASAGWTGHLRRVVSDLRRHPRKLVFWSSLMALYPAWAFVQQGIVFAALLGLREALPPGLLPWAPAITAMIFAAIHLPNYHLMFTVGFMVSLFVAHMDMHHNLAALAVAHGVLATLWRLLSPPAVSATLNVWGWYAVGQRELMGDLAELATAGRRWARPPAFHWFRQVTGGESTPG